MQPTLDIDKEKVWKLYREHGTVDAVASSLGLTRQDVGPIIDAMPLRQVYRRKGSPPRIYNRPFLVGIMKQAARVCGEPITLAAYHKAAPEHEWPAALTITREFGTWEAACKAADVKANPAIGPQRGSYTVDDCLVALRVCKAHLIDQEEIGDEGAPSYERYCKWARENQQPSGPTVRVKVGPWREALRAAYGED